MVLDNHTIYNSLKVILTTVYLFMCLYARSNYFSLTITTRVRIAAKHLSIILICHYILHVEPTFMKAQICTIFLDMHIQDIKIAIIKQNHNRKFNKVHQHITVMYVIIHCREEQENDTSIERLT